MFDADSPVSRLPNEKGQRFALGGYYTHLDAVGAGAEPNAKQENVGLDRRQSSDEAPEHRGKNKCYGESRAWGVQSAPGKPSKAWRRFRESFLSRVAIALRLPTDVDVQAAAALEVALGDAARAGLAPSFADAGARAGYTRRHLPSRAAHVANLLLLDTPTMSRLRQSLFMRPGRSGVEVVSVGGGPGFDAVGVSMVAAFALSPAAGRRCHDVPEVIRPRTLVLDNEPGWRDCVNSISNALGDDADVDFSTSDLLLPLADDANAALSIATRRADLFVFAHVVVENAVRLSESRYALLRDLFVASASGAAFIFTDNTHRLWPDVAAVASSAVQSSNGYFEVSVMRVHGKRGHSLLLWKQNTASDGTKGRSGLDFSAEPDGEAKLAMFRVDYERWAAGRALATDANESYDAPEN
jgi:hypothetical protein